MAHLLDYENAEQRGASPKELAVLALDCADKKAANARAWNWGEIAAKHAQEAGIENALALLGNGRRPNTDMLRKTLKK